MTCLTEFMVHESRVRDTKHVPCFPSCDSWLMAAYGLHNFLINIHNRHHISCSRGQVIRCLLWMEILICVLPLPWLWCRHSCVLVNMWDKCRWSIFLENTHKRHSIAHLATIPLKRFWSNFKFDQNTFVYIFSYIYPITKTFSTSQDSIAVLECAKFVCDWILFL